MINFMQKLYIDFEMDWLLKFDCQLLGYKTTNLINQMKFRYVHINCLSGSISSNRLRSLFRWFDVV